MATHRGTILLVDDEEKILKALGRALRDAGHAVVETTSPREAQRLLAERSFDLLVVDNMMPQLSGLDLIREYVSSTPENERSQILMMTAHATVESAIEAMKLGALDYLQKPFEIDELLVVARRALEHQRLTSEYRYLRNERDEQFGNYGIIGRSRLMREIIERAERVAQSKSTVLITGETGTGKELVARAIHNRSAQRDMPLIKVNCAAIPETLLESELFGHVRGAFTGAATSKKGKFALADGGSIFLDEIGTMSPALQAKLLRVLQEREFEPLGSERTEKVDVRVIAATNRDLRQMVVEAKFQEDLYYRLNVIPMELPPLRDRRDDIPALVDHFVSKHAQRTGRRIDGVADGVVQALQQYRLARERAGTGEHHRAGRGAVDRLDVDRRFDFSPRRIDLAEHRPPVPPPSSEHRMGGEGDDSAGTRGFEGCEEGRRRADGNQPACVVVLPGQVPDRLMLNRFVVFAAASAAAGRMRRFIEHDAVDDTGRDHHDHDERCQPEERHRGARQSGAVHQQRQHVPRDGVEPASGTHRLPGDQLGWVSVTRPEPPDRQPEHVEDVRISRSRQSEQHGGCRDRSSFSSASRRLRRHAAGSPARVT